jgi:hypothetical protein
MPINFKRGKFATVNWTVAEAVTASITDDVSHGGLDDATDRLNRKLNAQAEAIGQLAGLIEHICPPAARDQLDAALNEIISSQFTRIES